MILFLVVMVLTPSMETSPLLWSTETTLVSQVQIPLDLIQLQAPLFMAVVETTRSSLEVMQSLLAPSTAVWVLIPSVDLAT